MLGILGEFPRFRGDYARAIPIKERALELARSLGEQVTVKALLCDLSSMLALCGEVERARMCVVEAIEIEHPLDDPSSIRALGAAAELAEVTRDNAEAKRLYLQIIERLRRLDDTGSRWVWAVSGLAESLRRLGDNASAAPLFVEALQAAQRVEVFTWISDTLESVAGMIAAEAPERGAALMGAADAARRETGLSVFDVSEREAILGTLHARLDAEPFEAAWNEGSRMSIPDAIVEAVDALSTVRPPSEQPS
jgi:tetratricopeptide (TPR) repeat protein